MAKASLLAPKNPGSSSAIAEQIETAKSDIAASEAALDELSERRDALLIDGTDDQIREVETRISSERLRAERAEKRIEKLTGELEAATRDEIIAALVIRAKDRCANFNGAMKLNKLKAAYAAAAAMLAEINQDNEEANAINPHLPSGCEPIPIIDATISGIPGHGLLIRWLTSMFPLRGFDEQITVRWRGPSAYPDPVKAALAKLEENRRAVERAAQATHPAAVARAAPTPPPRFFSVDPGPAETSESESSARSLVRDVRRYGSGD